MFRIRYRAGYKGDTLIVDTHSFARWLPVKIPPSVNSLFYQYNLLQLIVNRESVVIQKTHAQQAVFTD